MIQPIYLQDYKVESEQGNVNYSVVGALPNQMPGVETKQYTWNFVSHMILEKCSRLIRIRYDFKDTEFQKEITFEDKLMGTVQLGSKVYNARDIMKYKYDKELLEMEVKILFPLEEKICGKDLSWNIFINDLVDSCCINLAYGSDGNNVQYSWSNGFNNDLQMGSDLIQTYPSCSNINKNKKYAVITGNITINDTAYSGCQNFCITNVHTKVDDWNTAQTYPSFLAPIVTDSNINASWQVEGGSTMTYGPASSGCGSAS